MNPIFFSFASFPFHFVSVAERVVHKLLSGIERKESASGRNWKSTGIDFPLIMNAVITDFKTSKSSINGGKKQDISGHSKYESR